MRQNVSLSRGFGGAILFFSLLTIGCSSQPEMSAEERRLRLICATLEPELCVPQRVNTKAINDAFIALINRKFQPVFAAQQAGTPIKEAAELSFPDDDWVFINSSRFDLPEQVMVGDQAFKQYSEKDIRAQGITHFLDILEVEQYGDSYLFTWAYGMEATFGKVIVEFVPIAEDHRVATLDQHRSALDGHNYMVVRLGDAPCQNDTQLAYFRNNYLGGQCKDTTRRHHLIPEKGE